MADKRKKRKWAAPIGVLTLIFAVIGLITAVRATVDFAKNKADQAELKAEYEKMLKPVVMFDPDPFDDLTKADKSQLLYSAIWSMLQNEEGMSKYVIDQGGIRVPQGDVEKAFIALFGTEIDIASLHSTIDMSEYGITYDSALQAYIIPITGVDSAYVPKVISIEKQGTSVILEVGYINQRAWADIGGDELSAPEPDKYMKITIREGKSGQYIASIQNSDNMEVASQLITTTQPVTTITAETEETEPMTDENGETITTVSESEESNETETSAADETTAA